MKCQDFIDLIADTQNFLCLDRNVGRLPLGSAQRLMDHDPGIGQRIALSLRAGGQEHRAHAGRLSDADRGDIRFDVLHRIVDRHAGRDHATRRIDVEVDVLVRILGFEKKQLGDQQICDLVVDRGSEKNDPVFQQPGIDVIGTFALAALFDHHWNQRQWSTPLCGGFVSGTCTFSGTRINDKPARRNDQAPSDALSASAAGSISSTVL